MSTTDQLPIPAPVSPVPAPISPVPDPVEPKPHRPRGKIQRLPAAVRERINTLMQDGLTYPKVLEAIGDDVRHINDVDLSRWFSSGHQDYLKNQLWIERACSRLDFATSLVGEKGAASLHLANLHIAATQLIEHLAHGGDKILQDAPDKYVALLSAITRLSHEALNFQKYSEACVRAHAEVQKLKDPTRKLSEAETLAIVDKLDEILGFK